MKTKLLKKVRRRFKIIHKPLGHQWDDGDVTGGNHFWLIDNSNEYYIVRAYVKIKPYEFNEFTTEKACINYLKSKIICILKREGYRSRKDNTVVKSYKQVWP
jgi:hypothetical protein